MANVDAFRIRSDVVIQLYGTDLQTVTTVKKEYRIKITHKPTGTVVEGTGDHEYALSARLMCELRDKVSDVLSKQEEEENYESRRTEGRRT